MQIAERVIPTPPVTTHPEETIRIRLNPITRKELLANAVELLHVEFEGPLVATAKKASPVAWETFYQFNQSYYVGKVNPGIGLLEDPRSDLNFAAVREKIGYDLYRELGKGLFDIPSTYLSSLPLLDHYHQDDSIMRALHASGVNDCWRILSPYPAKEGNLRLGQTKTLSASGEPILFCEYVRRYHKIPDNLIDPNGASVPLAGLVELLAVMRIVGDTNGFGANAEHVGIVWKKCKDGVINGASVIKLDAGQALSFDEAERHYPSKDIPLATEDHLLTIQWEQLPPNQKELFLSTLINCLRYKNNQGVVDLLVHRQGKFSLSEEISNQQIQRFTLWLDRQEEVYGTELTKFILQYPHLLLRICYLDQYGEVSLAATNETYPLRELYTHFLLVQPAASLETEKITNPAADNNNHPSMLPSTTRFRAEEEVAIDRIFTTKDEKGMERPVKNVGIVGPTGMGKSLLCQQIAHQIASEQLWPEYKYVYWLPLRFCNTLDGLKQEKEPLRWLSLAITALVLQQPPRWLTKEFEPEDLISSFHTQLKAHLSESLVLFDGHDEAVPHISGMIQTFLSLAQLKILITSRPEALHFSLDRLLESKGFSQEHIGHYARRFFTRRELTSIHAEEQTNAFLKALHQFPICLKMAQNPLLLQLLCKTWEQHRLQGLPPTTTTLYKSMLVGFLKESPPNILEALGTLAYQSTDSALLMMPGDFIETILAPFSPLSLQDLLRTDVIRPNVGNTYSFLHLSFQQYLVAWHISQKPKQAIKDFIVTHRHYPNMRQSLIFLAGILSQQNDDLRGIKFYFKVLHRQPGANLTGAYTFLLLLSCLKECADNIPLVEEIIQTYGIQDVLLYMLKREIQKIDYSQLTCEDGFTPFKVMIPEIPLSWISPLAQELEGILIHSNGSCLTQPIMYLAEFIRVVPSNQILDLLALVKEPDRGELYLPIIIALIDRVDHQPNELLNGLAEYVQNVFGKSKSSLTQYCGSMLLGILSQAVNNPQLQPEPHLLQTILQGILDNRQESEKLAEITEKMVPKTSSQQTVHLFQALLKYADASKSAQKALKALIQHARPDCIPEILAYCKSYSQDHPEELSPGVITSLRLLAKIVTLRQLPDLLTVVTTYLRQENTMMSALEIAKPLFNRFPNCHDKCALREHLMNIASPQIDLRRQAFAVWKTVLAGLPLTLDGDIEMYHTLLKIMNSSPNEVVYLSEKERSAFAKEPMDVMSALLQRIPPATMLKLPDIYSTLINGCFIALEGKPEIDKENLSLFLKMFCQLANSIPAESNRVVSFLLKRGTERRVLGPTVSVILGAFFCDAEKKINSFNALVGFYGLFTEISIETWIDFIIPAVRQDDMLDKAIASLQSQIDNIYLKFKKNRNYSNSKHFEETENIFQLIGIATIFSFTSIDKDRYFLAVELIPYIFKLLKCYSYVESESTYAEWERTKEHVVTSICKGLLKSVIYAALTKEVLKIIINTLFSSMSDRKLFETANYMIKDKKSSELLFEFYIKAISKKMNRMSEDELNTIADSIKSLSDDRVCDVVDTFYRSLIKVMSEKNMNSISIHLKNYSLYNSKNSNKYLTSLPLAVHFNYLSLRESDQEISVRVVPWIIQYCQMRQVPCFVEQTADGRQISYIENNLKRSYPLSEKIDNLISGSLINSPFAPYLAVLYGDAEVFLAFCKVASTVFDRRGAHRDACIYVKLRIDLLKHMNSPASKIEKAKKELKKQQSLAINSPYATGKGKGCLLL